MLWVHCCLLQCMFLPRGSATVIHFQIPHILALIWSWCYCDYSLSTFHVHFLLHPLIVNFTLQSSKVSRTQINRLTRKERRRRGQASASDHNQRDKPHVSFADVTAPSSTRSSTCHSKLQGPNLTLRRQTLLLEDGLDSALHSQRNSFCSMPDINKNAPVSGSRSVLLHQTADREPPPPSPSSPHGQCYDICVFYDVSNVFLFLRLLA